MLLKTDIIFYQEKIYGLEGKIWKLGVGGCWNQPIICSHTVDGCWNQPIIWSHTVVGLRQMDSRLILITRADFIFTPISTLNWTTGSVMMNMFTFVHRMFWKILRVIFMISFLNLCFILFFLISKYIFKFMCECKQSILFITYIHYNDDCLFCSSNLYCICSCMFKDDQILSIGFKSLVLISRYLFIANN